MSGEDDYARRREDRAIASAGTPDERRGDEREGTAAEYLSGACIRCFSVLLVVEQIEAKAVARRNADIAEAIRTLPAVKHRSLFPGHFIVSEDAVLAIVEGSHER